MGYDQLTASIIDEATKRRIPCIPLEGTKVIQLGYGANQRRILKSFTNKTSLIGVKLSGNKEQTKKLLSSMGIPVPLGKLIYSSDFLEETIKSVGYPLTIKPVNGSNGRGVGINILNFEDAVSAFKTADTLTNGNGIIVEEFISGLDYRILVINNKFVAAAKRTPAMIKGDGYSTIRELISLANQDPKRGIGHTKPLTFIQIDSTTEKILKEKQITIDSVLAEGESIFLKLIANLSGGGTSTDVTDLVHPNNILIAERITRIIGLDVCGIDIISPDISVPLNENNGSVIEVNSKPGFRLHIEPTEGTSRNVAKNVIDMLFPDGSSPFIPIISVVDFSDNELTSYLITKLLNWHGFHVGYAAAKEVSVQNIKLDFKNLSFNERQNLILKDPTVDFAVFDYTTSISPEKNSILSHHNVGILINFSEQLNKFHELEELSKLFVQISDNTLSSGYLILSADDIVPQELNIEVKCKIAYFSSTKSNSLLIKHINEGGYAAYIDNDLIMVYHNNQVIITLKLKINSISLSMDDRSVKQCLLAVTLIAAIYCIDSAIIQTCLDKLSF